MGWIPRSRNARPLGAGLTYCAGFELSVRAGQVIDLVIEVEQQRWGGTDLDPPRKIARHQLKALPQETTFLVSTDDGTLGHPCAEVFRFLLWRDESGPAELEIAETQTSQVARVIRGTGWTAAYPRFHGPNDLTLEYRPQHGYLD